MEIVAARAQCSRQTLARLESGSPEVSVGVLARVLNALQMPDELLLIAKNDEMGKVIQDIDLKNKKLDELRRFGYSRVHIRRASFRRVVQTYQKWRNEPSRAA